MDCSLCGSDPSERQRGVEDNHSQLRITGKRGVSDKVVRCLNRLWMSECAESGFVQCLRSVSNGVSEGQLKLLVWEKEHWN